MKNCPHCGKVVQSLIMRQDCVVTLIERFGTEDLDFDPTSEENDVRDDAEFLCPHCNKKICVGEEEAKEFLKEAKP
jgi:hypothetical protein